MIDSFMSDTLQFVAGALPSTLSTNYKVCRTK
jgi:hypothetical protein